MLPVVLLRFWFFEAPVDLVRYFSSFNTAFLKLFSFQLILKTFFKPWKNEYRQGLVGFSLAIGIITKSMIIVFDLALLCVLLFLEVIFTIGFVFWPVGLLAFLIK